MISKLTSNTDNLSIDELNFTAFLDDSQEQYEFVKANVPNVSIAEKNIAVTTRVLKKIKFVFTVIAEDIKQCKDNYENLKTLINNLKPKYKEKDSQKLPHKDNLYGLTNIKFNGLITTKDKIKIQITNFSYEILKETGYLQDNNVLIPIAFKISIDARVPQKFEQQSRVIKSSFKPKVTYTFEELRAIQETANVQEELAAAEEQQRTITIDQVRQRFPNMIKNQANFLIVSNLAMNSFSAYLNEEAARDNTIDADRIYEDFERAWSTRPEAIRWGGISDPVFYVNDEYMADTLKNLNLPDKVKSRFRKNWGLWKPTFGSVSI